MKKNSLLKALVVVFIIYFLLSWIVPVGIFSDGEFIKTQAAPLGILDLIIYPLITLTSSVFILTALVILLTGGFYGVLNKTGAYGKMVDGITKKFKGSESKALVIITLAFIILSSLTGLTLPLFILVPFAATILLQLGYRKFDAMLSTIGGMLVGNIASTYGVNVAGYISYLTENINDSILVRIILLVLVSGALIFTLLKTAKIDNKNKEEFILYEKNIDKKSKLTNLIVISIIMLILLFVGMFNWANILKIELFNNIYDSVVSFEIGGYPLFKNIIGSIPAIGEWTNYELAIALIIVSYIIGKLYRLKLNEIVESFIGGMKKMVPVAIFTIFANILFLLMNSNSQGYTMFNFIANSILNLTKEFNALTVGLVSFIGSIFYNEFPYMLSSLYSQITTLYKSYSMIGIITQSIHGLVQLIVPTSTLLVAGLTLFDIEYKEWLKKLFKFFIALFIIIVLIIVIILFTI